MLSEYERLGKEIGSIEERLEQLPEGKLICAHNQNHFKWYQSDGHHPTYIPKSNRQLAEQLAERKYLTQLREDAIHEQRAIQMYLRHHKEEETKRFLKAESGYSELLKPAFQSKSRQIKEWEKGPYEKGKLHPEKLIFETGFGIRVRSKSELMIADVLQKYKIPFHYEEVLKVDGVQVCPDFTIRHPKTGKYFYWEHFGMMDEKEYAKRAGAKMQLYLTNGYLLSVNLIVTSETREQPLTSQALDRVVRHYFL